MLVTLRFLWERLKQSIFVTPHHIQHQKIFHYLVIYTLWGYEFQLNLGCVAQTFFKDCFWLEDIQLAVLRVALGLILEEVMQLNTVCMYQAKFFVVFFLTSIKYEILLHSELSFQYSIFMFKIIFNMVLSSITNTFIWGLSLFIVNFRLN